MKKVPFYSIILLFLTVSSLALLNGLIPQALGTTTTDTPVQITKTGCPSAQNCASGSYPTESSFFLPFTQQKLFQNPRPTSRQDYYVFYRQNMSIPGSGCSGGTGPDFCDECIYSYSHDGITWRNNQTIGSGIAGVGNFYYNCSATFFDNAANNQLIIYVAVARNAATAKLGHNLEFVIGAVADTADAITWSTVQTVVSSTSTQNFQFPVIQVDPNGYLQIAYSWVDVSVNRQTVDLCSSRTPYPTSNPSWTCNGGNNNSLFDAWTQLGQTDASFMPQLQPISGHSVLVLQGPCSSIATSACDGPSSLTENATLVNWDGTTQTFIPTATFNYSSSSPSDRRSSTADRATGTFYIAYENGTDGKFWTRYLAKPYTAWTSPTRITTDDGEGRISLLTGTGMAKTLAFVEASDKPITVSGGGGKGTCGTCPQIDMYTNITSNGTEWSAATTFYSNTTWAAAWASIPWYINTTTTSKLPVMWEQHDCGAGTNVACVTQPEELWFDPHALFTPTFPPKTSFAILTTFDGRIFKYSENGSLVFVSRPVGSALRQVAWKPDGSYALIVGDQGVVYKYDGTTLSRFSSTVIGNTNLNTVAWKPDGSYALIGGQNGFIFQYNGTAATKITDPTTNNIFSISWNPNGNSALIVGDKGTALTYTLPSKIIVLHSGTGAPLFAASWNPSGTYALAAGGNSVVLLFNGTTFKALSTTGLAQSGHNIRFIGFNPAGSPGLLVGDAGLVWTYDGTKLSSIVSGTANNLFSLSWLGSKAYIVGQNGTLFTYSAGTLTKLNSGTNVNFASIAWQSQPLSVKFTFSPASPTVQAPVSFRANPSGGAAPYSFSWNFGDGTSGTGSSVTHSYSSPGPYNVTVIVTDTMGSTSQASALVTVQPPGPPVVTVSSPTPDPALTGVTVNLSFATSSSTNITGVTVNWGDGSPADNLPSTATKDTHVYTSTGALQSQIFNITVTATNSGGSASGITTETVNDRPPAVTLSSVIPNPALTGQTVNASFTATDPDGTVSSITVNWGDGSLVDILPGTATSDTHSYASTGTFTITVVTTDNSGSKGQTAAPVTIQSQITRPAVTVGSPTPNPANTGTMVNVTFTVSSSATVTGITVNWGDGTPLDQLSGTARSDSHVYSSTGSAKSQVFRINVTATNSAGSGSGTTSETVNDQPPIVTVSSVTSPTNTGQLVNVTFSANDPDGTVSSISVNWGDGTPADILPGTATSDSHNYNSTGSATSKIFLIAITATDNSGSNGQATASVTINDRPPAVDVSGASPNPALVGQIVSVSFSTNDPDGTVSSIIVNWGDGSQPDSLPGTATTDTHTYGSGGTFTITITATDNSGSQGSGTTSESVNAPLAPTVTINSVSPNPANTGQTVTVTFTVSSTTSVTGITVNWGDGSIDSLTSTATSDTHIYTSTGNLQSRTFNIIVTATSTAGSGSASTSITVNDRAPTLTLTGISPNPAVAGSTVTATFTATDSDGTVSSIPVNWGDGSPVDNLSGTATSDTHSYSTQGNFTITIVATDNSGSKAQATATITVTPVITATPYALAVTTDGHVYKTYTNGTMVPIGQPVLTALRSVSWKPDGSYALISGDSAVLLKYDGTQLTAIPTGISTGFNFWSVSWKPDGSYALIAGTSGLLFKYDGISVTMITDPNTLTIFAVSWNPTGTSALLVGKTGTALTFDGTSVHTLSSGTTFDLDSIGWNPNGQYALIGGLNGTVLRYDGTQVTTLLSSGGLAGTNEVRSIAFNPQGTLALLVGDNGMVLTYNGSTFTKLAQVTFVWLYSVSWGPNGTAYILGSTGNEFTYSNGTLTKVSSGNTSSYRASAWKP